MLLVRNKQAGHRVSIFYFYRKLPHSMQLVSFSLDGCDII